MKLIRVVVPLLLVAGGALIAEVYPEFVMWMKHTERASGVLRTMEQKTGPKAVRAAEELGGVYEEMIGFWRQRDEPDAVKIAEQGKAAAVALASAANGGDAANAEAAFKTLSGTCRTCHESFREKLPDGTSRIKQHQ